MSCRLIRVVVVRLFACIHELESKKIDNKKGIKSHYIESLSTLKVSLQVPNTER